ncbi:hypothetical protein R3P38DRAFT_3289624 [Favolaschia claudopus]|uniref:Uncharacterized protein n=1 Tax=Favolaschia claudopus TaxID=2862362 RepID=A0AAV9ZVX4_9AGAR
MTRRYDNHLFQDEVCLRRLSPRAHRLTRLDGLSATGSSSGSPSAFSSPRCLRLNKYMTKHFKHDASGRKIVARTPSPPKPRRCAPPPLKTLTLVLSIPKESLFLSCGQSLLRRHPLLLRLQHASNDGDLRLEGFLDIVTSLSDEDQSCPPATPHMRKCVFISSSRYARGTSVILFTSGDGGVEGGQSPAVVAKTFLTSVDSVLARDGVLGELLGIGCHPLPPLPPPSSPSLSTTKGCRPRISRRLGAGRERADLLRRSTDELLVLEVADHRPHTPSSSESTQPHACLRVYATPGSESNLLKLKLKATPA